MTIKELMRKQAEEDNKKNRFRGYYYIGYIAGVEHIIDKAIKWLYEHREEVQTEDNGISGWIPDKLIMDFKQAMETF
jgi:hypothetical protein